MFLRVECVSQVAEVAILAAMQNARRRPAIIAKYRHSRARGNPIPVRRHERKQSGCATEMGSPAYARTTIVVKKKPPALQQAADLLAA
jgi:hypothetical protein